MAHIGGRRRGCFRTRAATSGAFIRRWTTSAKRLPSCSPPPTLPATRPPSSGAFSCDLSPKLGACTAVRSQACLASYRTLQQLISCPGTV
uniref:Uncharacterized protein n=1 Tax=Arundo donax TaxID=35708 RepID=A0A0A8YUA6_ARUDO